MPSTPADPYDQMELLARDFSQKARHFAAFILYPGSNSVYQNPSEAVQGMADAIVRIAESLHSLAISLSQSRPKKSRKETK